MAKSDRGKGDVNAFMGPGSEFEGRLHFTGSVRLDGAVTGEIESQGVLIIGPTGRIQADIKVDTVIICGEVRGDVTASRQIEIKPPAQVYGTLTTPSLIIHEGAKFEGASQMTKPYPMVGHGEKVAYLKADHGG